MGGARHSWGAVGSGGEGWAWALGSGFADSGGRWVRRELAEPLAPGSLGFWEVSVKDAGRRWGKGGRTRRMGGRGDAGLIQFLKLLQNFPWSGALTEVWVCLILAVTLLGTEVPKLLGNRHAEAIRCASGDWTGMTFGRLLKTHPQPTLLPPARICLLRGGCYPCLMFGRLTGDNSPWFKLHHSLTPSRPRPGH